MINFDGWFTTHFCLYNDKDGKIVSKEYLTHLLVNVCSTPRSPIKDSE